MPAFPKPLRKDRISAKRDVSATAAQKYLDKRSHRTLDGKERLFGVDMGWRRIEVYAKYRGHCAACGFVLVDNYELDHIIPRGRGGDDSVGNLQPLGGPRACSCHRGRKGSKHA